MNQNMPPVVGQNGQAPPNQWAPPAQPTAPQTPATSPNQWAPPNQGVTINTPPAPAPTPPLNQGGAPTGAGGFAPPSAQDVLAAVSPGPTIIDTSSGLSDGLNKCPKCGSADVMLQPGTGMLQCNFCRAVFESGQKEGPVDAAALVGERIGSGAANITQPDNTHVTIKCQGCGSEVVIDINETMSSRCHWCRQVLSIENQIPNGAVPDLVLPFLLSKQQAQEKIQEFVKKRTFFAHPKFKKEFTTENIIGVYLPYLVVDASVHGDLRGDAGHVTRQYTVGSGDNKKTVYDIDVYNIGRDFDLLIDDLTVEASSDKLNVGNKNNTNNVINTILPFDIQNAVPYNGNYLKGFNSERRDVNIDALRGLVDLQIGDVVRFQAGQTAKFYDAGIEWQHEDIQRKGMLWKAAYLPVWLYSYYQKKGDGTGLLHYVAVNARTGETMGSVPMNMPLLLTVSAVIEAISLFIAVPLFVLTVTIS